MIFTGLQRLRQAASSRRIAAAILTEKPMAGTTSKLSAAGSKRPPADGNGSGRLERPPATRQNERLVLTSFLEVIVYAYQSVV